jgi:anti-sigma regulatory factor (Ser/Thr protein kinase)
MAQERVRSFLSPFPCSFRALLDLDMIVEEIFINIANYAYGPEGGTASIRVTTETDPKRVSVTLSDSGIPYNPLLKQDPDVTLPAEKRKIGGLGIYMVKQSMDDFTYEYSEGRNVTTITKILDE